MIRKRTLICAVAVALSFPTQTFAAHGGTSGRRHGSPEWHSGPVWHRALCGADGTSVRDGAVPDGAILVGMMVPDGAGTGGMVAGGEVMA
jgi:hypothetical protein